MCGLKIGGWGGVFWRIVFLAGWGSTFLATRKSLIKDDWVNAFAKRNKLSKRGLWPTLKYLVQQSTKVSVFFFFFDNLEVFEEIGMRFLQNKKGVKLNSTVVKAVSFLTKTKVFKPLFFYFICIYVFRPNKSD